MYFGQPLSKLDYARRAAAALAFLANDNHDSVGVTGFDAAITSRLRAMRGQGHLLAILSFLNSLGVEREENTSTHAGVPSDPKPGERGPGNETRKAPPPGNTDLASTLRTYMKSNSRPGIVFILSDFLDGGDFRRELSLLVHENYDVNLIQILSREEMEPELAGNFLLIDSETRQGCEISEGPAAIAAYKTALRQFTSSLQSFSRTAAIGYGLVTTDQPLEDLLLKNLIETRMLE
jgi:hypothetical protein